MRITRLLSLAGVALVTAICFGCMAEFGGNWSDTPPEPPSNISVSIIEEGLLLSWPCVPGATHYTLFWGTEPYKYEGMEDTPACSIIVEGLQKSDLYRFALSSWNEKGESGLSEEIPFVYETDPAAADEYVRMGDQFMKKREYDTAYVYYSTAIRLNPEIPSAYTGRAALHRRLDRVDLAKQDLNRAKELTQGLSP